MDLLVEGVKFIGLKTKKFKIGVINLMGNVFMRRTENVFQTAKERFVKR